MRWSRILLVFVLALSASTPASAQLFGKRPNPKGPPEQRVPELLVTLKTDIDKRKRTAAAEELQYVEITPFPTIVPALLDALENDPKTGVRLEVVHTLGKLRPVSVAVGQALEKVASHDSSIRVRLQARTTLMWYHLAGYNGAKTPDATTTKTTEPPLANPKQLGWTGKQNGVTTTVTEYRPLPVGPTTGPDPRPLGVVPPPQPVNFPGPALLPQQPVTSPTPLPPPLVPQR